MKRWLLAALLCLAVAPASGFLLHATPGSSGTATYSDLCSQSFISGSCVYSYDLDQRRVSTNTVPFQLTRLDNSATINASYTGSTFTVNVAALISACGGTTTTLTYSTQYNNCVYTTVYDQTGSGCDLVAGGPSTLGTTHAPPLQIRLSDGLPAIIQTGQTPASGPGAKFLYKNGCTVLDGSVARTMIGIGNNAYFSGCCGQYGKIETAPAPGNVPAGAMWSATFYHNGSFINYGVDIEGGGGCTSQTPTSLTPVIDSVGLTTYSSTAGGTNTYLNNVLLGVANCAPQSAINTQDGVVIGCSGDYTACGPIYFRGMTFLNIDASLTGGLPTQIYNYLTTGIAERSYVAIGDSITYGQFASPLTNSYAYLIAADNAFALTNRGIPSEYTCQAGNDEVFPFYAPLSTDTTLFTILLGTNDAAFEGVGGNEALYENCLMAEATWLSIPDTSKVYAQAASKTGRWAADNTDFVTGVAEKIPSAGSTGSTLSFTITVRGGAIYIWYAYNFSGTAAFSYAVDGGSPTTVTPTCSFACAQPNTGIVRITGQTNASHTVLITDTVGQPIVIAAVGTVPTNVTSPACCRVLVGGVLQQLNDTQSAATAAYDTDSLAVSASLVSDGLDVAGVIVRTPGTSNPPTPNFVCSTSTCMFNQFHPNNLGHRDLANSFESFGF